MLSYSTFAAIFFFDGWMANMNRALVISQSEEESPFAKLRMVSND